MPKPSITPEKPTLETLLKFKRREQPSAEFWNDFDRALQSRLTREYVSQERRWDKRVWWVKFSAAFSLAASVAVAFLLMDAPGRYLSADAPRALSESSLARTDIFAPAVETVSAAEAAPAVDVPPVPQVAAEAPAAVVAAAQPVVASAPVIDVAPAPSPVLEKALLRETSFAALKEKARPAQSALLASAHQADGYTKVWARTALPENGEDARFVSGATPAYEPLPGVATYVSCAY